MLTLRQMYKRRMNRKNAIMTFLMVSTVGLILITTGDHAHALILDPARQAFSSDLTASGFSGPSGIELFFGFIEFLMLAIPVATGLMALAQMNRGPEAWMPWFTIMGGSLVFVAFVTVIIQRVYA